MLYHRAKEINIKNYTCTSQKRYFLTRLTNYYYYYYVLLCDPYRVVCRDYTYPLWGFVFFLFSIFILVEKKKIFYWFSYCCWLHSTSCAVSRIPSYISRRTERDRRATRFDSKSNAERLEGEEELGGKRRSSCCFTFLLPYRYSLDNKKEKEEDLRLTDSIQ